MLLLYSPSWACPVGRCPNRFRDKTSQNMSYVFMLLVDRGPNTIYKSKLVSSFFSIVCLMLQTGGLFYAALGREHNGTLSGQANS